MTESGTVHLATPVWVSAGPDCAHDSSGTQGVCSKRSPGGLVSKDPTSALSHLANQVPRFGGGRQTSPLSGESSKDSATIRSLPQAEPL